jgi:hypothetical protein
MLKECNDDESRERSDVAVNAETERKVLKPWTKPQLRRIKFATKEDEARFRENLRKKRK